jgi:uncharacterized membrane protein
MKVFSSKYLRTLSGLLLAALAAPAQAGAPVASQQDIDIRGLGHTPEWQLEISHSNNRVRFTLEGTEYSYRYPEAGPSLYQGYNRTTIYRVPNDEHALNIIVKGIACRDSETGKAYETSITVTLDGAGYTGCGDVLNR